MQIANLEWRQTTPVSKQFDDIYFSPDDGISESQYVFIEPHDLPQRWSTQDRFTICETGFGTGLNFLLTWQLWLQQSNPPELCYISFERFPLTLDQLKQTYSQLPKLQPLLDQLLHHYPAAIEGFHKIMLAPKLSLLLVLGDINTWMPQLQAHVDSWYLDGFAPSKNPDMWSDTLWQNMTRLSHSGTTVSSFTAASSVKKSLTIAGFALTKRKGFGRKREMILGEFSDNHIPRKPKVVKPWFAIPKPHTQAKTVTVIGAGMAGCSLAYSLSHAGFKVNVIDQADTIASGASGNPTAMAKPYFTADHNLADQFYSHGFELTRQRAAAFSEAHPIDFDPCGAIELATNSRVLAQHQRLLQRDFSQEILQACLAEQASEIAGIPVPHSALYYPQAFTLSPQKFCQALLEQSQDVNVSLGTSVKNIVREKHWNIITDQQSFTSDIVIVAAGAMSHQLPLFSNYPIIPTAGQLNFADSHPVSEPLQCILSYDGYLLPAQNGLHTLGATYRHHENGIEEHQADTRLNQDFLLRAVPELAKYLTPNTKTRVSVRANTTDHLPLIGPVADLQQVNCHYAKLAHGGTLLRTHYPDADYLPGLFLCSGFGSKGLVSCTLAAELIKALILGTTLPISLATYQAIHPSRYWIRTLQRSKT